MRHLSDKDIEHHRYDERANSDLKSFEKSGPQELGALRFPEHLREPYLHFESMVRANLKGEHTALEIGAGSGQYTGVLIETGASILATDISESSLKLLKLRISEIFSKDIDTRAVDMEELSSLDGLFDMIVCAGSLSYGRNDLVLKNVYQKLKPGGYFICVDSLNDNIIYKLNRYIHYLRGERSFSTLKNMPNIKLIEKYKKTFSEVDVKFFGALSWAAPLLQLLFSSRKTAEIINYFDTRFSISASAFKFVMVCKK